MKRKEVKEIYDLLGERIKSYKIELKNSPRADQKKDLVLSQLILAWARLHKMINLNNI